jgi:hypothetical protein
MNTKIHALSFAVAIGLLLANAESITAQSLQPGYVDDFAGKPRVVVLRTSGMNLTTRCLSSACC